jgi:hypothetical protein
MLGLSRRQVLLSIKDRELGLNGDRRRISPTSGMHGASPFSASVRGRCTFLHWGEYAILILATREAQGPIL